MVRAYAYVHISRSAWIALGVLLAAGCARFHLAEAGAGDAGERASQDPQPEADCTPCGERQTTQEHLRCLCRATHCPTELDRALSDPASYAAYGRGCGHTWLIDRIGRGYDLYVYGRRSGSLVYIQRSTGDDFVQCEDGTESLISEAGEAPNCSGEQIEWCRLGGTEWPIGIGELDSARTCDERTLR